MRGVPATRDDDDYVKTDVKDRIDRLHKAPLLSHPDKPGNVHFFRKDSAIWAVRHTHTCLFSETF